MVAIQRIAMGVKYGVIAIIVAVGVLLGASITPLFGHYSVFAVLSGSMEPAISTGSIVIVKPQSEYRIGDIVTVKSGDPKRPITHRISAIHDERQKTFFITKGDANSADDVAMHIQRDIIGRVVVTVPFIGYPIGWVQTTEGFIILLVIPSVLVVYHEILAMTASLENILRKKRRKKRKE